MTSFDELRGDPQVARLEASLKARAPREENDPAARPAAVAILLRLGPSREPEVFFIQRAEYEGDPWSGHIAFPGGRAEPDDESLMHTAMRETYEETGFDLEIRSEMIGILDDCTRARQGFPR